MTEKPDWLSYAVDFAQIGSAIFTAAAVFTAVWLALRNERQRPKFAIYRHSIITIGGGVKEEDSQKHFLALTIVNAGVLPIVVEHAHVAFRLRKKTNYDRGLGEFDPRANKATFPLKLEHGQNVEVLVPVRKGETPWNDLPFLWWLWRRPEFVINTSLGKTFRRHPKIKLLRHLNREVLK